MSITRTLSVVSVALAAFAPLTAQSQTAAQPPASAPASASFHQILRKSFGNSHETVSDSEFSKTVFADKLTQEQLIVHLQQRALVHNEIHRILIGAGPATAAIYGPIQKNVLILLFSDLVGLGSGWPTEAQALPVTKSFLRDLRDSEKNGPWFALGAWHVYYGGITNGGRSIGEEIGKTLKFTPAYYEKSDGYEPYIAAVDKITDPDARAEMIRGGQAVYRYIISINNDAVFKAK